MLILSIILFVFLFLASLILIRATDRIRLLRKATYFILASSLTFYLFSKWVLPSHNCKMKILKELAGSDFGYLDISIIERSEGEGEVFNTREGGAIAFTTKRPISTIKVDGCVMPQMMLNSFLPGIFPPINSSSLEDAQKRLETPNGWDCRALGAHQVKLLENREQRLYVLTWSLG